jgi:hypothetical protein
MQCSCFLPCPEYGDVHWTSLSLTQSTMLLISLACFLIGTAVGKDRRQLTGLWCSKNCKIASKSLPKGAQSERYFVRLRCRRRYAH